VYDCDYLGCGGFITEHFFSSGFARVSKGVPDENMKYGMIDKTGNIIAPIQYELVERFKGGLIFGGFGNAFTGEWYSCDLIDETGKEVAEVRGYDDILYYSEGFARVMRDKMYGFIDATGKEVVPCIFEDARDFSEGLAPVKVDGKWGYIAIAK
jgi:hypothetical protein